MAPTRTRPTLLDFGFRHPSGGHGRSEILIRRLAEDGFGIASATVEAGSRRKLPRLLANTLFPPQADGIFVRSPTFPLLLLLVWALKIRLRVPLIFDAMLSAYEGKVEDRGWYRPGSWKARVCAWEDHLVGRIADLLIVDTEVHAEYLVSKFGCPREKMVIIPVGSPLTESLDGDPERVPSASPAPVQVLYIGNYVPLHGVDLILQAARLVIDRNASIEFTFIGGGQDYEKAVGLGGGVKGLRFLDPVSAEEAIRHYHNADICLGVFGASEKAQRVIPFKAYDALALGKALVMQASPAARDALVHGENAWLVARSAEAIAEGILHLAARPDLRQHLGGNARQTYREKFRSQATIPGLSTRLLDLYRGQISP